MGNWDLLKLSAKRVAKNAIKETGEAADIAALHVKLRALEVKRDKGYEMLGRLTYRQLKTEISQAERIAPVINNLDIIRGRIRAVNAEIDDARASREERRSRDRAIRLGLEESEAMLEELVREANEADDGDDEDNDE